MHYLHCSSVITKKFNKLLFLFEKISPDQLIWKWSDFFLFYLSFFLKFLSFFSVSQINWPNAKLLINTTWLLLTIYSRKVSKIRYPRLQIRRLLIHAKLVLSYNIFSFFLDWYGYFIPTAWRAMLVLFGHYDVKLVNYIICFDSMRVILTCAPGF